MRTHPLWLPSKVARCTVGTMSVWAIIPQQFSRKNEDKEIAFLWISIILVNIHIDCLLLDQILVAILGQEGGRHVHIVMFWSASMCVCVCMCLSLACCQHGVCLLVPPPHTSSIHRASLFFLVRLSPRPIPPELWSLWLCSHTDAPPGEQLHIL